MTDKVFLGNLELLLLDFNMADRKSGIDMEPHRSLLYFTPKTVMCYLLGETFGSMNFKSKVKVH